MSELEDNEKLETSYILKKTRHRPWGWIVVGLVAAAAAAFGLWLLLLR